MERQDIIKLAEDFTKSSEYNRIGKDIAIGQEVAGMQIYDSPIFAFGAADDSFFQDLKNPDIVGDHIMLPKDWLPEAKTVITFFLPFTESVRESNRKCPTWPSAGWLHGRIEGQTFIGKLCLYLQTGLQNAGYKTLVPSMDKRFWSGTGANKPKPGTNNAPPTPFTSNWSERHAGFICGLGTFGLSKGIITPKGMAGRLGSVITELVLTPDARDYLDPYEYCIKCGSCVDNCPVGAITIEDGKDHTICSPFLDTTARKFKPRYGCGKCQVSVPCETCIPSPATAETSNPT